MTLCLPTCVLCRLLPLAEFCAVLSASCMAFSVRTPPKDRCSSARTYTHDTTQKGGVRHDFSTRTTQYTAEAHPRNEIGACDRSLPKDKTVTAGI